MGNIVSVPPEAPGDAGRQSGLAGIIECLKGNEGRRRALDADDVRLRALAAEAVLNEHHGALEDAVELTGVRRDASPSEKLRAMVGNKNLALNQWVETVLASEISAALAVGELQARGMIKEAVELLSHRRRTFSALEDGSISYQSARIILDHCEALQPPLPPTRPVPATEEQARRYEAHVAAAAEHLEEARDRMEEALLLFAPGHTPSQLRAKGRRLRERLSPTGLADRHQQAVENRNVRVEYTGDGMSEVRLYVSAAIGRAIQDRLDRIARLLGKDLPKPCRSSQMRADIAVELLLGTSTKSSWENIHADVMVVLPYEVLTGEPGGTPWYGIAVAGPTTETDAGKRLDVASLLEGPAELSGFGSLDAHTVRLLANQAKTWGRLFATPDGLAITGMARERYRPTKAQRRLLKVRDGTCTHPTCNRSALNEVDHIHEFQDGGRTDLQNLRPGCRLHHLLKTLGLWEVEANPDGSITHHSPAGLPYVSWPERPLEFLARPRLPRRILPAGCSAAEQTSKPKRPGIRRTPRTRRSTRATLVGPEPAPALRPADPWFATGHDARRAGPAF